MTCRHCGALVIWVGPFSALTHTECLLCGARWSQIETEEDGNGEEDAEATP